MDEHEYREKLNALEEQLTAVYRERRALTESWAEEHPAVLPPPRARSETQARVARCPRCGGSLSDTSGLEK
jgi:hypothetical protein